MDRRIPYDYRDGLIYIDLVERSWHTTKRLWALGNWSRFVQGGARRIPANVDGQGRFLVSAYLNPDGSLVTVVVNGHPERGRRIVIGPGGGPSGENVEVWETSADRDLELVYEGSGRSIVVPPASVTTVVLK